MGAVEPIRGTGHDHDWLMCCAFLNALILWERADNPLTRGRLTKPPDAGVSA